MFARQVHGRQGQRFAVMDVYQVARRGQIEVRRSGVAVAAGSVVIAPIYVDVMGTY